MSSSFYKEAKEGTFIRVHPTGSRYICNPPVLNTDDDYICLVDDCSNTAKYLESLGWELGGSIWEGHANYFFSFKKKDTNLIVVDSPDFYTKFVNATILAKKMNLVKKEDRVAVFQAILYGNF